MGLEQRRDHHTVPSGVNEVRAVLFWSLWFFLGVQLIFSSFFLSMLGISRDTYIGDYELKRND